MYLREGTTPIPPDINEVFKKNVKNKIEIKKLIIYIKHITQPKGRYTLNNTQQITIIAININLNSFKLREGMTHIPLEKIKFPRNDFLFPRISTEGSILFPAEFGTMLEAGCTP